MKSIATLAVSAALAFGALTAAPLSVAASQPAAVQTAQFDADGTKILVTTLSDGTLSADIGGTVYTGAVAEQELAKRGIRLTLSPNGRILAQDLAKKITSLTPPRTVKVGSAPVAGSAAAKFNMPSVMPENLRTLNEPVAAPIAPSAPVIPSAPIVPNNPGSAGAGNSFSK